MGRGSAVFFLWLIETGDVGQDSSAVTDPPNRIVPPSQEAMPS